MKLLNKKLIAISAITIVAGYFGFTQLMTYVWSQHGTSVLKECKCIIYTNIDPKNKRREIVAEGDPRFEKVKTWTETNLFNRLYNSDWIQTTETELPNRWVAFYSVKEPKDVDKEGLEIMHFAPQTLGISESDVEKKVSELTAILNEKTN